MKWSDELFFLFGTLASFAIVTPLCNSQFLYVFLRLLFGLWFCNYSYTESCEPVALALHAEDDEQDGEINGNWRVITPQVNLFAGMGAYHALTKCSFGTWLSDCPSCCDLCCSLALTWFILSNSLFCHCFFVYLWKKLHCKIIWYTTYAMHCKTPKCSCLRRTFLSGCMKVQSSGRCWFICTDLLFTQFHLFVLDLFDLKLIEFWGQRWPSD